MRALLRLSPDVTTKGTVTRARFAKRLAHNIQAAFGALEIDGGVERAYSRIFVDYQDPQALEVCRRVFGVHSIAPCDEMPLRTLDELVDFATRVARPSVEGRSFAVRARVRSSMAAFGSQEVNVALGRALAASGRVKLENPDVTVRVEVRDGRVCVFQDFLPGESGLPYGVGGRAVSLISGGFDSAVASYLTMRRGVALEYVCCRLGGEAHEKAVRNVVEVLATRWAPGQAVRLWIVPFEESVEHLRRGIRGRFQQLILKRWMVRVAEAVAFKRRADAIVTGECLGQVSSQTLRNLRALGDQGLFPVLRPVLTYSKNEILTLARHVGTYELSAHVPEYCALDAGKPATGASRQDLAEQEARLAFDPMPLLRASRQIELSEVAEERSDLTAAEIRATDTVLDLRRPPLRNRAPIPNALAVEPLEVLENPLRLGDGRILVVCEQGGRSLWFARRLRDLGLDAYSASMGAVQTAIDAPSKGEFAATTAP